MIFNNLIAHRLARNIYFRPNIYRVKPTEDKYRLRSYRTAYGTTVFSISLVLFMFGAFVTLLYHTSAMAQYVRENFGVRIELYETAAEPEIVDLKEFLENNPFTAKVEFISKEEAARKLESELGEDFVGFLGFNPLPDAFELILRNEFTHTDSVARISTLIKNQPFVKSVYYQENLLTKVNLNIRRLTNILLLFTGLFMVISILLIYNTIRLAVYAKRLIIKSMLLVGATQGYIRRPFVIGGILQGFAGGLIASLLIVAALMTISARFPDLPLADPHLFPASLSAGLILFGLLITWLSNHLAIKKYLKTNLEDLY